MENDELHFPFPEEGVEIIVPRQHEHPNVAVKKHDEVYGMDAVSKGVESDKEPFEPNRPIINFDVVDVDTKAPITNFNPPITLKLKFNFGDIKFALGELDDGKIVAFGYWNGKVWTRFTVKDHRLELRLFEDPPWAGYGVVIVNNWDDPSIGVGR